MTAAKPRLCMALYGEGGIVDVCGREANHWTYEDRHEGKYKGVQWSRKRKGDPVVTHSYGSNTMAPHPVYPGPADEPPPPGRGEPQELPGMEGVR